MIQIMNNQLVGEIAAVRTAVTVGLFEEECDDRLPWDDSSLLNSFKLLYFLGEYLGVFFFWW